jgi:predicted transcriptional regulator
MSFFRTYLADVLRGHDWTQQHLANLLDTDQASVSRWISGRSVPDKRSLGILLKVLPAKHRGQLLAAYLRDMIPDGCEAAVQLKALEGGEWNPSEGGPEFPAHIEPELKKHLVFLTDIASHSHDIRRVLSILYSLLSSPKVKRRRV